MVTKMDNSRVMVFLKNCVDKFQSENKKLKKDLDVSNSDYDSLYNDYSHILDENCKLRNELFQTIKEYNELYENYHTLKKDFFDYINHYNEITDKLQKEKIELKEKLKLTYKLKIY